MLFFIVALLGAVGVLSVNFFVLALSKDNIVSTENAPSSQAAIVLGAYVTSDGTLCDMLKDRVSTGVDLYKAGKVKKLLMSGDHGRASYDEVNNMRKYAQELGVPQEDIFMDHAGFSTYETMYRARDVFGVKSAVVVTQKFHLPRAIFLGKSMGISVVGIAADKQIYAGAGVYEVREMLARCKGFLQAKITHSKPTFLGPQMPIEGDGRATYDIK